MRKSKISISQQVLFGIAIFENNLDAIMKARTLIARIGTSELTSQMGIIRMLVSVI